MAADEGENLARGGARVFDDDIAAALGVADVRDDKGTAGSGGAEGEKRVKDMAGDAVFLGDEIRRVVLHVTGLSDDL